VISPILVLNLNGVSVCENAKNLERPYPDHYWLIPETPKFTIFLMHHIHPRVPALYKLKYNCPLLCIISIVLLYAHTPGKSIELSFSYIDYYIMSVMRHQL
jgi:hypothetical protein